ncbi:hypothetical protein JOC70_001545 [Clostridium pascui]|uniref:DUF3343 domain-containing protein n=1 Tax=Clostridium pascui TaxID=46609 RepID=UPI00195CB544|nr:DUF3343 domain-containing protein [Clostridium pascui]MBM7870075.1 hypothetical protein [Clostridium pascui]
MNSFNDRNFIIIIASSNRGAFLYKKLIELGVNVEIMATPCKLSKGCTRSIKCSREQFDIIKDQAQKYNITINGIYERIIENKKYKYVKVE